MARIHTTRNLNARNYIFTNQHRARQNANKSLWTITEDEEFNSFSLMCNQNWILDQYKGWSLHRVGSINDFLGVNPKNERVQIAKFVDSSKNSLWHGYPVNYRESVHDKPHNEVLQKWVDDKKITKVQMSKISRGKDLEI